MYLSIILFVQIFHPLYYNIYINTALSFARALTFCLSLRYAPKQMCT